jgi:hypothetical protein
MGYGRTGQGAMAGAGAGLSRSAGLKNCTHGVHVMVCDGVCVVWCDGGVV